MIARGTQSASVRSAIAYAVDDRPEREDDHPGKPRGKRVAWVDTINLPLLPTPDPDLAGRIMQGVIFDAPALRKRSGRRGGGRPLEKPCNTLVLSFHRSELGMNTTDAWVEKPHIMTTVNAALRSIGLANRQSVVVCHTDTDNLHVHVITSRVSPVTGIAAKLSKDQRKLAIWSEQYERAKGRIVCPARVARRERREQPPEERGPAPKSAPRIGPGRRARTPAELQAWDAKFNEFRREDTPEAQRKIEKHELRRQLDAAYDARVRRDARFATVRRTVANVIPGMTAPPPSPEKPPAAARRASAPTTKGPSRYAAPAIIDPAAPVRPRPVAVARPPLLHRIKKRVAHEKGEDTRADNRAAKKAAIEASTLEAKRRTEAEAARQQGINERNNAEHEARALRDRLFLEYQANKQRREQYQVNKQRGELAVQGQTNTRPAKPVTSPVRAEAPVSKISILDEMLAQQARDDERKVRDTGPPLGYGQSFARRRRTPPQVETQATPAETPSSTAASRTTPTPTPAPTQPAPAAPAAPAPAAPAAPAPAAPSAAADVAAAIPQRQPPTQPPAPKSTPQSAASAGDAAAKDPHERGGGHRIE